MTGIREINEMFRAGRYDEAYALVLQDFEQNSNNVWEQRKMGWALTFLMKRDKEMSDKEGFMAHFESLFNLPMLSFQTDAMLFDTFLLRAGLMPLPLDEFVCVWNKVRENNFMPSIGYSAFLRGALKHKEWPQLGEFLEWWDFSKFLPEDFEPYVLETGRRMMPLAEQAHIAYAKCLLASHNLQKIREFEPKLEKLADDYPRMTYPGYFCGRLLLVMDAETNEMLDEVLPFVRRKSGEFWVWQMLAEIFDEEPDKELACLLRAVHCRADEKFLGKVRIALAKNYLKRDDKARAKFHLNKVARTYLNNGWNAPFEILPLMKAVENVAAEGSDNTDYMTITNEIAGLQSLPKAETKILKGKVTANKAKTAFFVSDGKQYAFIPPKIATKVREGDAVTAEIQPSLDKKTGKMGWKCIRIKK